MSSIRVFSIQEYPRVFWQVFGIAAFKHKQ